MENNKIEKAIVSNRLVSSPCCLVTSEYGWSANMERIMKAQALGGNSSMNAYMMSRKTLELNIEHIIVKELINKFNADKNDSTFKNLVNLMYDTSSLASGFNIENPKAFSDRMYNMIKLGLSIDENETKEEEEVVVQNTDISEEESEMEKVD